MFLSSFHLISFSDEVDNQNTNFRTFCVPRVKRFAHPCSRLCCSYEVALRCEQELLATVDL